MTKQEIEEREDAKRYILENISAGTDPIDILNDLSSFYDGDIVDLF